MSLVGESFKSATDRLLALLGRNYGRTSGPVRRDIRSSLCTPRPRAVPVTEVQLSLRLETDGAGFKHTSNTQSFCEFLV